MFYFRILLAGAGFVVTCAYGITLALVSRDRSSVPYRFARLLAPLTQRPLGVQRVEIRGAEYLHAHRPCIYVCNHQSNFDTVVLASVYPAGTVVIAKKEVRSIPLFGWLFTATGNILIDRSDRRQAVSQLKAVSDEIHRRNVSVWIFPEGTRGKVPGELLPFKKGAFQMALAARCPLVPVVMSPLLTVVDAPARSVRPGPIEVRVLEPIPTEGLTEDDLGPLIDRTRARMQATLDDLVRRHGLPPSAGRSRRSRLPVAPASAD